MSINETKAKYAGNYMGVLWAFVQPLGTIAVLWFVFEVGFRAAPVSSYPFALWLSIGMAPWFFLSEAIATATNSIRSQSFLVKKIVFNIYLLPLSSIISSFFIHIVFILIVALICIACGYMPNAYWLGLPYYAFCALLLTASISYLTSSIAVFFSDMGHIVAMVLQFAFWLTPIFWAIDILPQKYIRFVELNPFHYIINGYRDSLINNVWFWERSYNGVIFWILCLAIFCLGLFVFSRLKPYFADVL